MNALLKTLRSKTTTITDDATSGVSAASSGLISFGSTTSGKEKWRKKDLPPKQYREILRVRDYTEAYAIVEATIRKKKCRAWLEGMLSVTYFDTRRGNLEKRLSGVYSPTYISNFKLRSYIEEDFLAILEQSKGCATRGQYRITGIQQPEKWEAFLYALRALPGGDRSVEDAVNLYKDHVVGDSDWGYGDPADAILYSTLLGDYYKPPGRTLTTIDTWGREWIWIENGTGFSDEFHGGTSKSGKYAWQLRDGEPTHHEKITDRHLRTPVSQGFNKRVLEYLPIPPTSFSNQQSGTEIPMTARPPKKKNKRVTWDEDGLRKLTEASEPFADSLTALSEDSDSSYLSAPESVDESYDNFGEGPSSRA